MCYTTGISTPPNPRANVTPRRSCSGRLKPGSGSAQVCSGLLTLFTHRAAVKTHLTRYRQLLTRGPKVPPPPPPLLASASFSSCNGLHLIKGEHAARQMAYGTQLDWINKMFTGANVTSLKKTRVGRSQGAKLAELNGVNEGQIRRAGRWNSDALTSCCLTHLPRKFMRTMAGFSPSIQGSFYLLWAKTLPPQLLEQAVWPFADEWLAWFDSYANSNDGGDEDDDVKNGPHIHAGESEDEADRRDLAAQGFIRLSKQLRIILLQDSAIMKHRLQLLSRRETQSSRTCLDRELRPSR